MVLWLILSTEVPIFTINLAIFGFPFIIRSRLISLLLKIRLNLHFRLTPYLLTVLVKSNSLHISYIILIHLSLVMEDNPKF